MSKHVGLTTSCSTEDPVPEYSFFVYDDDMDVEDINREACAQEYYAHKRRKKMLSPQMMDMMSEREIEEWYERNGSFSDY